MLQRYEQEIISARERLFPFQADSGLSEENFLQALLTLVWLKQRTFGEDSSHSFTEMLTSRSVKAYLEEWAEEAGVDPAFAKQVCSLKVAILKDIATTLEGLTPDPSEDGTAWFTELYEACLDHYAYQNQLQDYTAPSLVELMVHLVDPAGGRIMDPACGHGGMLVHAMHYIEVKEPYEDFELVGQDKQNDYVEHTNMRLWLYGQDSELCNANTYQEDACDAVDSCDIVLCNPPFNDDKNIDFLKMEEDPDRLPFGIPAEITGKKKKKAAGNANMLWLQYAYSLLNREGRAAILQPSAGSTGKHDLATIQGLLEANALEAVIQVGPGFHYAGSIPCSIWLFNLNQPESNKEHVLLLNLSDISTPFDRKLNIFTRLQLRQIQSVMWLYRGEQERYLTFVAELLYGIDHSIKELSNVLQILEAEEQDPYLRILASLNTSELSESQAKEHKLLTKFHKLIVRNNRKILDVLEEWHLSWEEHPDRVHVEAKAALGKILTTLRPMLAKHIEQLNAFQQKLSTLLQGLSENDSSHPDQAELEEATQGLSDCLKETQASYEVVLWLFQRFPHATYQDSPGLCKRMSHEMLEQEEYNFSPSRHVGIAPRSIESDKEDFAEHFEALFQQYISQQQRSLELSEQIEKNLKMIQRQFQREEIL